MTKTRFFLPLFVILVMGMATSAFAQISCDVASAPVSRAVNIGHTEQVGDLIFNCTGGTVATTTGVITINYPGLTSITNNQTNPVIHPITISNATGGFSGGGAPTIASVSNTTGQIVISVPGQSPPAATSSFTLTGVLASLVGTGLTSLNANISVNPGSGLLIGAGQNVATVITNIVGQPLSASAQTLPALYFSGTGGAFPGRDNTVFTITENFIDFFRNGGAGNQYVAASHDTQLLVKFSGLPAGSFLTGCTATGTGALAGFVSVVTAPTSGNTNLLLDLAADANLGVVESITVTCTGLNAPTTLPTTATTVTATVEAAPVGTAFCTGAGVGSAMGTFVCVAPGTRATPLAGAVPRFASTPVSIGIVLQFTPNTTTMIIPYAVADPAAVPPAGTFDTGIAIANTSTDVIGTGSIFGANGASPQPGTITFNFFPEDGAAAGRFSFTTPSIPAGASYVVNVSEILKAAGRTAAFSGYIIAVANFTNAHGAAFVYGGVAANRLTSATEVLVIPSPVTNPRTATGGIGAVVEATTK